MCMTNILNPSICLGLAWEAGAGDAATAVRQARMGMMNLNMVVWDWLGIGCYVVQK